MVQLPIDQDSEAQFQLLSFFSSGRKLIDTKEVTEDIIDPQVIGVPVA